MTSKKTETYSIPKPISMRLLSIKTLVFLFCNLTAQGQEIDLKNKIDYVPCLKQESGISFFKNHYDSCSYVEQIFSIEKEVFSYSDSISFEIPFSNKRLTLKKSTSQTNKHNFSINSNAKLININLAISYLDLGRINCSFHQNGKQQFMVLEIPRITTGTNYNIYYCIIDINNNLAFDYWSIPLEDFFIVKKEETVLFPTCKEVTIELYDAKIRYNLIELYSYISP